MQFEGFDGRPVNPQIVYPRAVGEVNRGSNPFLNPTKNKNTNLLHKSYEKSTII